MQLIELWSELLWSEKITLDAVRDPWVVGDDASTHASIRDHVDRSLSAKYSDAES